MICESKLPKTLAEEFENLRAMAIPPNASTFQVDQMKKAFFAGAYFVTLLMRHIADNDVPDDQAVEMLQRIVDEAETFAKGVINEQS